MRSIVQDKTNLFFKILEHDKNDWWQHWMFYARTFREVFEAYRKVLNLPLEKEEELVKAMNRPFLDRLKLVWEEQGARIKEKTVKVLSNDYRHLESRHGNFTVFIMGLTGIRDVTVIELGGTKVFLADIVSIFKKGCLEETPFIIVKSIEGVQ